MSPPDTAAPLRAQVPDWYHPRDRVEPTIEADVTLDPESGDFLYHYTVFNGAGADQRIETLRFELAVTPTEMRAPDDWEFAFHPTTPVVSWWAVGPPDPAWSPINEIDEHIPSTLSEIAPGEALSGFELLSPCAPTGSLTFYARGYAHVSVVPEDADSDWIQTPAWRDDSVTGTTTGPGACDD